MKRVALLVVLAILSDPATGRGDDRPAGPVRTVAVLDFVNRNPADGREWLGKGLADMVTTDLSASRQLTVVDRQRLQELMREIALGEAGILDPQTAPKVGQIAKVRWVLFGTFFYDGDHVSLDAMLIDVEKGQTVRIEQVEGPAGELFNLESKLVQAILAKLDVPMTDEELRMVKLLKTQSLPAFEHYARSLALFDQGQWFDALREGRLARRADPAYFAAALRVAQLFYDVGEPEHAVVEYRRFLAQDPGNTLPESVYLALGKILEQALGDRAGAIAVFQRLVRRDSQYDQPFHISGPSRVSHGSVDVGGLAGIDALFLEHRASLEALERLARWQLEAGEEAEAARLYGRLWLWMNTHGMARGTGTAGTGFHAKVLEKYSPLYWRMVLENRDATLYPACPVHLLPADIANVGPDTPPTHGHYKWGHGPVWLAPPDREIGEVSFSLEDDGRDRAKALEGKIQIDLTCMGYGSVLRRHVQVKPDGAWHIEKLKPGVRALQTYAFTDRWQLRLALRPWSQPAKVPAFGGFQVNFVPSWGDVYVNGESHGRFESGVGFGKRPPGRYDVEVRWPDGRRKSASIDVAAATQGGVFLNADLNTLSRQVLAPEGSNPWMLTDRTGRIWLLWDQACRDWMGQVNSQSNLFFANSGDGISWSRPRRLPVSSLDCDTTPIMQQDRHGVFWLVWVSSRDPKAPKSLWIASSPNGIEWSFPRKLILPETAQDDLARWCQAALPRPAFAIDVRNVFWLVWQGWLIRSEDAHHWQVDSVLRTGEYGPKQSSHDAGTWADNMCTGKSYCLASAAPNSLLLLTEFRSNDESRTGPMLWRRTDREPWKPLGYLTQPPQSAPHEHAGSIAVGEDGTIRTIVLENGLLLSRKLGPDGSLSEPLCAESRLTMPFHPSVASLPDGRFLVAFGSKDGLVVTVLQEDDDTDDSETGESTQ